MLKPRELGIVEAGIKIPEPFPHLRGIQQTPSIRRGYSPTKGRTVSSSGVIWDSKVSPKLKIRENVAQAHTREQVLKAIQKSTVNAIILRGLAPKNVSEAGLKLMYQAVQDLFAEQKEMGKENSHIFRLGNNISNFDSELIAEMKYNSVGNNMTHKNIKSYLQDVLINFHNILGGSEVRGRLLNMEAKNDIMPHVDLYNKKPSHLKTPWRLVVGFGVQGTSIILDSAINRDLIHGVDKYGLRSIKPFDPKKEPPSELNENWIDSCVTLGAFTPVLLKMEFMRVRTQPHGCLHFSPPSKVNRPILVLDIV
jgi:hypothetical protein